MAKGQYEYLTCYFLSGTGNSYRAAQWMARTAEAGVRAELVPVADAKPKQDLFFGPSQLVGIYHPAHGMMPPWSMIKFLLKLPLGHGAHAFVAATRGGIPLRPLVIPGGTGLGLFFPLLVLFLKGYRVRGGVTIDMPVNMMNLHWGLSRKNVEHIINWGRERHQRMANRVINGHFYFHPINVLWELLWCVPFVLFPTYPILYLFIARVFMGKLMFADTSCKGCGACARNCAAGAIRMVDPKPRTPYWTHHCEVCMRCMGYCKFQAVQASHLWMVVVLFGTSFLTAALVQDLISYGFGTNVDMYQFVYEGVAVLMTFGALLVSYWIFFGLQRLRPLRILFAYTTFTKLYKRRYHVPGTKAKQLNSRSRST